jgi:hypothetical protein
MTSEEEEEEGGLPVHGLYVLALDDLPATAAAIAVECVEVGHAERSAVPFDELLEHLVTVAALEAVVVPWLALSQQRDDAPILSEVRVQ